MKKLLQKMMPAIVVFVSVFIIAGAQGGATASAINVFDKGCSAAGSTASGSNTDGVCGAKGEKVEDTAKNIINTLLYVVGIVAVLMIIIGGIRYAASNGDSSAIQGAKNTVLYAVIGLIVAIMAFAIVNFVVGRFGGSGSGNSSGGNTGTNQGGSNPNGSVITN